MQAFENKRGHSFFSALNKQINFEINYDTIVDNKLLSEISRTTNLFGRFTALEKQMKFKA
jgi:hypothetical protein